MEAICGDPNDPAAACYRELLRTGTAPLGRVSSYDEIDLFTEKVIALAAADNLTVERYWDPVHHGNVADPCPVLVTGIHGEAYWAARERHGIAAP